AFDTAPAHTDVEMFEMIDDPIQVGKVVARELEAERTGISPKLAYNEFRVGVKCGVVHTPDRLVHPQKLGDTKSVGLVLGEPRRQCAHATQEEPRLERL